MRGADKTPRGIPAVVASSGDREMAAWLVGKNSIPEPTTGCWLWEKCMSQKGYGHVRWPRGPRYVGSTSFAHRLSYFAKTGGWPPVVRHRCDQPACVNPDHLEGGTHVDNVSDMDRRGRRTVLRGERHGSAKLTEQLVREIRGRASENRKILAAAYGVDHTQIRNILIGKHWKHVL